MHDIILYYEKLSEYCGIERCDKEKHPTSYRFRRIVSFPFRVINKIKKIGVRKTVQAAKNKLRVDD